MEKNSTFDKINYAWPPVNSRLDYKYIKNSNTKPHFRIVMHNCKLFSIYPNDHNHTRDSQFFSLAFILKGLYTYIQI